METHWTDIMENDHPGSFAAGLAFAMFRARHRRVPCFRRSKNPTRLRQTKSNYRESASAAREFIKEARAKGFRGSFISLMDSYSPPLRLHFTQPCTPNLLPLHPQLLLTQ